MNRQREIPLVLVADDEIHTTIMLERIFTRENYEVIAANNGVDALNMAQELLPDLLLLDIQMPLMNGFEVLKALREAPATNTLPTIIITARARQPTDVAHGLNLGADDYVYKPFDPKELLARARSKIRSHHLEMALQRRTQELEALLKISDELSQYVAIDNLLTLVPKLILEFLPGDEASIGLLDEDQMMICRTKDANNNSLSDQCSLPETFVTQFMRNPDAMGWSSESPLEIGSEHTNGMIVPLIQGDNVLGFLLTASNTQEYDDKHLQLFRGVGRQAALAISNAQLYEIQANYALHLEDMVNERTKELESAQQLLIRAEKLASIGHLAASIAHEINNPLQPIRINLEHILEDIQDNVPIDIRAIETIQESVERIRRIVSRLLEFTGKRNLDSSDIQMLDIGQIIESVISLNQKFFEKEGVQITTDFRELLPVYGSKDQLEQVFMNIFLNAKSAMQQGGILRIATRLDGDEIIAEFEDNGIGIPELELGKIFDPFYSTKANGTGLGLFVSYGIVQQHHGSIEVSSRVNEGTIFTVRLPVHKQRND
ncbi:MAG: response regulator [Anaerolineaceae bacterium]|nr:response regulator [Anaerolineaceae bacterium]